MTAPRPEDRLQSAYLGPLTGARAQAALGAFVLLALLGALIARGGTLPLRVGALAALGVGVGGIVAARVAARRELRDLPTLLRRALGGVDRAARDRALRAERLVCRTARDPAAGDAGLARHHLDAVLSALPLDRVQEVARRRGIALRSVAFAALAAALGLALLRPAEIVEGADVLVARDGVAPLALPWLRYARITALPPPHTRLPPRSLVPGTAVTLPEGTVLVYEGVPVIAGRRLVVRAAEREVPLAPDGRGGVAARIQVDVGGRLRVAARFGEVRIEDTESLLVETLPDAVPEIVLDGAPREEPLGASPRLELTYRARDDHGLRQVDLRLRSGAREERRTVARLDGSRRAEQGTISLRASDPFLRAAYAPVELRVEARDDDAIRGPKWATSEAVVLVPPAVGEPEALRLGALRAVRAAAVDLLAAPRGAASVAARAALVAAAAGARDPAPPSLAPSPSLEAFVAAQVARVERAGAAASVDVVEDVVLALDAAIASQGTRDARAVAKRLAGAATDAAAAARAAREPGSPAAPRAILATALGALERGASRLAELGALGRDLGGVTRGDAARIRRAETAGDLVHAELASLHLAARLERPAPSFGAKSAAGRGGGGVEAGHGAPSGEGALPRPSDADRDFDRAGRAVEQLAEEHDGALRGAESALDEAARGEGSPEARARAAEHAAAVREAARPLPRPGEEFGSPRAALALAREHAESVARALEGGRLDLARDGAEAARGALDQAERALGGDDPSRADAAALRRALSEAARFAEEELAARRARASERVGETLRGLAELERELARRADGLSRGEGEARRGSLPGDAQALLERAARLMREAAEALARGDGARAVAGQREAQRLLEAARPGGDPGGAGSSSDGPSRAEAGGSGGGEIGGGEGDRGISAEELPASGGDVPARDEAARAEALRRRVVEGLGRGQGDRLRAAVRRYAEGLLR